MPRLSKKTMFAIEAVLDVAFHAGEHPVRSGDITERQRIPKRYLEQVLQHLVRAGILSGKRGPRGGYRLGRDQRLITLGEVVRVVRKLEAETEPNDPAIGSPLRPRGGVADVGEAARRDDGAARQHHHRGSLPARARQGAWRSGGPASRPIASPSDRASSGLHRTGGEEMAKAKAAKAKPNPRNKKLYDDGMKVRKAVLGAELRRQFDGERRRLHDVVPGRHHGILLGLRVDAARACRRRRARCSISPCWRR